MGIEQAACYGDGGVIEVAEYLPKGLRVYEQPPFEWLVNNDNFVPRGMFKEGNCGAIFWLIGQNPDLNYWSIYDVKRYDNKTFINALNSGYNNNQYIADVVNRLHNFFQTYYKYAPKYLYIHYVSANNVNMKGERYAYRRDEKILSYAAYHADQIRLDDHQRWVGLSEVVPSGHATHDGLGKVAREKKPTNRFFRLVVRSEALR